MFKIVLVSLSLTLVLPNLAQADYEKGVEASGQGDYEIAFSEWLIDANQGHAQAQYNLGVLYFYGEGVPKNYPQAVKWFRLSTDQGVPEAQFLLGYMYANGLGVRENKAESVKLYRLSADQGFADAQNALDGMYANDVVVNDIVPENNASTEFLTDCQTVGEIAVCQDKNGNAFTINQQGEVNFVTLEKPKKKKRGFFGTLGEIGRRLEKGLQPTMDRHARERNKTQTCTAMQITRNQVRITCR